MSAAHHPPGVAEQFETMDQQIHADLAGIWLFLATEMLFFGGLFLGFAVYRFANPDVFAVAATRLNLTLGTVNTVLLITSGLVMSAAEPATRERRRGRALAAMAATAAIGIAFLAVKGYEYHEEIGKHLAPFLGMPFRFDGPSPARAQLFFDFYFALTGLHALHMLVGLGAIAAAFVRVWRWRDPASIERQVRITGLYWAFVDSMWLFVFPTLYLLRA